MPYVRLLSVCVFAAGATFACGDGTEPFAAEPPGAPPGAAGSEFSASSPVGAGLVVNVEDFGAVADGVTDDGPAIQEALHFVAVQGGGEVYIPAGSYFVDRVLLIGDHTVVRGQDRETTTLIRGNTQTSIGYLNKWIDGVCVRESETPAYFRSVFVNDNYNCGNVGIEIHELGIDGSNVVTGPLAPGIAMSGNRDLVIDRVLMRDMAQDAIFLKNGGQNTSVTNTRIESFNMRWYNGGGINIEMWSDIRYPGGPLLQGNTISAAGPAFCSDDGRQPCDEDSDCVAGQCAPLYTGVAGIAVSAQASAKRATPTIVENLVEVSEGNLGIRCLHCEGSRIDGNAIVAVESETLRSGRMWGMFLDGDGLVVTRNHVQGAGVEHDLRGVLVDGGHNLTFVDNHIENKNVGAGYSAAVTIRNQEDYVVMRNTITGIEGRPALELGPGGCGVTVPQGGVVQDNTIEALTHEAVDIRAQHHLRLVNNALQGSVRAPCGEPPRFVHANETSTGIANTTAYSFTTAEHQARVGMPVVPALSAFSIVAVVSPHDVAGNGGHLVGQFYDVLGERMVAFARPNEFGIQIGGTVLSAPAVLADGVFHSIAITRDSNDTVALYLDGTWVDSDVVPGAIDQQATSVARVKQGSAQGNFVGEIDELWIFDDALGYDEVDALHDGSFGPEDAGVDYWDFEAFAAAP